MQQTSLLLKSELRSQVIIWTQWCVSSTRKTSNHFCLRSYFHTRLIKQDQDQKAFQRNAAMLDFFPVIYVPL